MSRPSTSDSNLGQLEEDLSFHQVLLDSLNDQEGTRKQREDILSKIEILKEQIAKMQKPPPNWGSSNNHQSSSDTQPTGGMGYPYTTVSGFRDTFFTQPTNTSMSLPNRKRQRNAFDDEFDALDIPESKYRRTPTPRTASPARSIDSFGTDLSDDPTLKKLLGNEYGDERRNTEQYLKDLEIKRRQEQEDADFARQLQEEWNDGFEAPLPQPKPNVPPSSYSQSLLRPDGSSFQQSIPPIPQNNVKPEHKFQPSFLPVTVSSVSTPSSDDSEFEEITSNDWTRKFGAAPSRSSSTLNTNGHPYNTNSFGGLSRMPGSFPGLSNGFASTPGSSVYGNSPFAASQFNTSTSSLGNAYNPLGSNHLGMDFLGSSRMPFDLDNYNNQSSLSYAEPEQTQEEIKDLLKHIRPDEDLTPEQLAEIQPDGLKITLMPHQRKGFAWMKSMEEGSNKGGILADDMGLGKTVQALALILGRPPPVDEHGRRLQRPTLIVAPVALLQQWEREMAKMVRRSHQLNVLILHGTNRNSSWSQIKNYDVVLTTYGLLASDLKRKNLWDKHLKLVPDAIPTASQLSPVLGPNSRFHRIILDEAQNIKNKSTKAATAACHIQADYRWCLSGTPMQNSVDEIYSLIKFCRIRPYHDSEKFARDIGRPLKSKHSYYGKDKAMQQLQALLRAVLLRRTKKSEIDGKPIIQLPEKHTVEDRAVFSKDEVDFYKALETQAQIQFNRFLKNGTVGRHYSHALVLLLRLRQCCCSPQLVTNAKDFLVNGALQDLNYPENAKLLSKEVVKRLSDMEAFECPICMDAVENPIIFNPCGHSLCQECLSTMVDKALSDAENLKVSCPHCRAHIDPHKVTDHESFLRVHFPDHPSVKPVTSADNKEDEDEEADSTDDDDDSSEDEAEDEEDDGKDMKDFIVPDDEDIDYDTDASESTKTKHVKKSEDDEQVKRPRKASFKSKLKNKKEKKRKSKEKKNSSPGIKTLAQLRAEGLRNRAAKKKYIRRLARGFQPSTKIDKTMAILQKVKDNGEGEKTIIFSSFTSFLDLLEVAMSRDEDELGTYTRYDGSMSAKDRNEAVNRFTDDPRCTAMLVSLKAGNAGLNLTAANHVIILDPFWNPFVEYQAADRCYRIGQTREVTIHRVLIGEGDEDGRLAEIPAGLEREFTVEDRILALQEKKKQLVETALDEKASGNIGRLGTRELGFLFGVNSL